MPRMTAPALQTTCRIRLGTRASPLARWQADWVAGQLRAAGVEVELVPIATQGDQVQTGPIGAIGTQGVFTKEIQRALLDRRIDLAVHSLKDLPTDPVSGLCLAAVPPREAVGDALVGRGLTTFDALPQAAVLGTGSVRRRAQLWHARSDLRMEDVRGNVDTRLRKLDEGQYDALILAEAGLRRLGLADRISQVLPKSLILPAVGQGALGLESREDDHATRACLTPLDDPATHAAVLAERALLAALRGGCLAPVGAWGRIEQDGQLHLTAAVLSGDGRTRLTTAIAGAPVDAAALGRQAADSLLLQGAADLIQKSRGFQAPVK
jgi:hydroxymethylbilane synthase